ncbi:MAG: hypothetical protein ACJAYG_002369 [Oceanicoccus sp.]|jgi:hypothetical protein
MATDEKPNELGIYDMVDKFIALANELVETQDVGRIGTAMRYATARFNAHESSLKTEDLSKEKADAMKWFGDQFQQMLSENIDVHIKLQAEQRASQDH